MKMTTRVAYSNMKYYKSRNILIGIAIALTAMLLLIIPTVGKGMIDLHFATINELYPTWHALYRGVEEETVQQLAVHHDISRYGLRSDVGEMNLDNASISMLYIDKEGLELYRTELSKGTIPTQKEDIVVSAGILKALGVNADIGDTIIIPFQRYAGGELDFTETKEFKICGFLKETELNQEQEAYTALVSEAFLKSEISREQIVYRFLFQIDDTGKPTTDVIEEKIKNIAAQFGIEKDSVKINEDYLEANYVDPVIVPAIAAIMGIIMLAGVITIYSIYYVSMNQRIREFGRLKAIGATKRQVKQIVLREGFCVAAFAIPTGLLAGTFMSNIVMKMFARFIGSSNLFIETVKEFINSGKVSFFYWWVYLLAIAVTLCTVYFSLVRPMHIAAKISEVEAIRLQGINKKQKSRRKGYTYLTIFRLTRRNLMENKKKSLITVFSMAFTGIFLMVVATVLSCANPVESANNSIVGQYEISIIIQENNKEHPERRWSEIQKDNPLNEELKRKVEGLEGVKRIDAFTAVSVTGEVFEDVGYEVINGIPEEYAKELEKGITKGKVTYEELKSGDKVIIDRTLLYWYPELEIGDKLKLTIHDGNDAYEKEIEIAAVGEYASGLTNYGYLIMAKEAADKLCKNNSTRYFHVIADKDYDETLEKSLKDIAALSERIQIRTWKNEYEQWKAAISMTSGACYAFLGVLAIISIMNLVNTMLNSVHVRKKEIGMMQAIGMADSQLLKMLQLEGLFYTFGTLLLSVGIGSLAGYPVFLYAKSTGMFNIMTYHYPIEAALIVSAVLILTQMLLAVGIGRGVKKESLIERVRFSE